jgi:REP element-mobilizing transposase RayT
MLRGTNRIPIYGNAGSKQAFLEAVKEAKAKSDFVVLAYCLMNNHVHLLIQEQSEPIGQVVKRFAVRYSGWYNAVNNRIGHVFQDRFKSEPVEDDSYLLSVLGYIYRNPVKAGIVSRANAYRWSSYNLLGRNNEVVDNKELAELIDFDVLKTYTNSKRDLDVDHIDVEEEVLKHIKTSF